MEYTLVMNDKTKPVRPDTYEAMTLPPDGFSRFFVIVRLLEELYGNSTKSLKILDVGGCSPYLAQTLGQSNINFELTVIDILPKPQGMDVDYIQDDITSSPLKDNSYDVVVSTDVLEHIPKEKKDEFVHACVRLSKEVVIIAAPFASEGVDTAEHQINDFNKKLFGVGQGWLEEHFKFTKPSIKQVSKILDTIKASYVHFGANNLYSWAFSSHINLMDTKQGFNRRALKAARVSYNQELSKSVEFNEPTYRHFFVIFTDKALYKKDILKDLTEPTNPGVYTKFVDTMMNIVYEHSHELAKQLEVSKHQVQKLEQQLENERIHTQKLHKDIERREARNVKNNIRRLRHPKSTAKSVVRKVAKKRPK